MNYIIGSLSFLFILLALGVAGSSDYEEAVTHEQHYCEMVSEGLWGAYDSSIDCSKVQFTK